MYSSLLYKYALLAIVLIILSPVRLSAESAPPEKMQETEMQETQKISVNLKEADLLDILKMFSKKAGWNLVIGEEVSGKVSLNLYEVTLENALAAVINISGYAIERKDDILFVRSKGKLEGPPFPQTTEHKTYRLHYAKVKEVAEVIKKYLSPYARWSIHAESDTLFIEDIPDTFPIIEPLLREMDRLPQQVLIEAKILEVKLNDNLSFGVDWKALFARGEKTSGTIETSGFSRLPGGSAPGLFFSVMGGDVKVLLDALQEEGTLNTLATPKLLALNHKQEKIVIGARLGFRVNTTAW